LVPAGIVRTSIIGVLFGLFLAVFVATPALADPAGPTDYRSEVVAIEPPTSTIEVTVIGGDSFVELTVAPGSEAVVIGYQGEEYLWIRADGTVLENENSPSTYLNEDRYATDPDTPATATADAEAAWVEVGSGHRWAWHDHRAHWMQTIRPPGLGEGDQILEAVIPLTVDGREVDVTVISVWQPSASPVPALLGLATGVGVIAMAWVLRRHRAIGAVVLPPAVAALVVGVWQFTSLPSETGPRPVWWILPALAVVAGVVGSIAGWRGSRLVAWGAILIAGVEMAVWGWIRSDGLSAAIIPTDAPGWLDRYVTALALVGGLGLGVLAVVELFSSAPRRVSDSTEPTGSPHPAHP
jgi:hypothetical protein